MAKFCGNCGAEQKDSVKFCVHCGQKFEDFKFEDFKPDIIPEYVGPDQDKGLNRRKGKINFSFNKKALAPVAAILVVLSIVGIVWFNSTSQKISRAADAGDYREVLNIMYEKNLSVNSKKLVNPLKGRIKDIIDDFDARDINYDAATAEFDEIKSLDIAGIEDTLYEAEEYVYELNSSRQNYQTAEGYFAKGEYVNALEYYALVIPEDSNYDDVQDRTEEMKDIIMDKADNFAKNDNYEDAVEILQSGLSFYEQDSTYAEKYEEYLDEYENSYVEKYVNTKYSLHSEYSEYDCTYVYNEDGLLKEQIVVESDGSSYSRSVYEYDENMLGGKITVYDENGKITGTTRFTSDSHGRILQEYDDSDELFVTRKYDENGNLLEYSWLGDDGTPKVTEEYIYNENNQKEKYVLIQYGDTRSYEYTYDSNGELSKTEYFDEDGYSDGYVKRYLDEDLSTENEKVYVNMEYKRSGYKTGNSWVQTYDKNGNLIRYEYYDDYDLSHTQEYEYEKISVKQKYITATNQ